MLDEPIKSIKFPLSYKVAALQADLDKVLQWQWHKHYNTADYQGDWSSLSLFAPSGDENNILAMANDKINFLPTPVLKSCDYFQKILTDLACPKFSVRLLRLGPGSEIKPHSDAGLGYEYGNFRLHIPITTHAEVGFFVAGEKLNLQAGQCWYINASCEHWVYNRGDKARVHLVIDCERNAWSDEWFYTMASPQSLAPPPSIPQCPKVRGQMLVQLENMEGPAVLQLIAQLKALQE